MDRENRSDEDDSGLLEPEDTLDDRGVPDVPDGDGLGDSSDTDGELLDDQVGDERAGRLVATDEGSELAEDGDFVEGGEPDEDDASSTWDVDLAGAGASAEEAAVHVVEEPPLDED